MATEKEEEVIAKHMRNYGQLMHAEAEKMEILGIETTPNLFDKAREIYFLAEQIGKRIKVVPVKNKEEPTASAKRPTVLDI